MEIKKYLPVIIGGAIIILAGGLIFLGYQYQKSTNKTNLEATPSGSSETANESAVPTILKEEKEQSGQISADTQQKLTLAVTQPGNGTTTNSSSVVVKGKTIAKADVFVNEAETKADSSGNFSVSLKLDEGENYILVVAADSEGNSTEQELTMNYEIK